LVAWSPTGNEQQIEAKIPVGSATRVQCIPLQLDTKQASLQDIALENIAIENGFIRLPVSESPVYILIDPPQRTKP
jgi:hypothetical protein